MFKNITGNTRIGIVRPVATAKTCGDDAAFKDTSSDIGVFGNTLRGLTSLALSIQMGISH